jgi:hypothetical protein
VGVGAVVLPEGVEGAAEVVEVVLVELVGQLRSRMKRRRRMQRYPMGGKVVSGVMDHAEESVNVGSGWKVEVGSTRELWLQGATQQVRVRLRHVGVCRKGQRVRGDCWSL